MMRQEDATESGKLTTSRLLMFAAPAFVFELMHGPGGGILAGIYAKYYGVSLGAISLVLLIARLVDAFTDPLIGYLSDRTKSRFGQRKPWVAIGYMLSIIAFYFLYVPGGQVSPYYFAFWYIALIVTWTMAEIPHRAWQVELTHDYDERSRVASFRVFAERSGRVFFAVVPLMPFFATTEMTPEVMRVVAIIAAVALPLTVWMALKWVPQGKNLATKKVDPPWVFLKDAVKSGPMRVFMGAYFFNGMADGFFSAVLFLFFDAYLQQGDKLPFMLLLNSGIVLMVIPIWLKVLERLGKRKAWIVSNLLTCTFALGMMLVTPGESGFVLALVLTTLIMLSVTGGNIADPAVIADLADYDTLKSKEDRAGQVWSLRHLMFKFTYAIAGALALSFLQFSGFDATAAVQSDAGKWGILLAMGGLPALFMLISTLFVYVLPLNRHRQQIIQKRLEQRKARAMQETAESTVRSEA